MKPLDPFIEQQMNLYYENNALKLRNLVHTIFNQKLGGIKDRDMTEFYSVANDVFGDIVHNNRFDPSKGSFKGFLYKSLHKAFIDEIKYQHRDKRCAKTYELDEDGNQVLDKNGRPKKITISNIYMDAPMRYDEDFTYKDTLKSDFDMDDVLLEMTGGYSNEEFIKYLKSLSKIQRQILRLKVDGFSACEIKKKLGLSNRQYEQYFNDATSFEKINILGKYYNPKPIKKLLSEEEGKNMEKVIQTGEKSKTDKLSIGSIIKKMDRYAFKFDHPLQRESGQWPSIMKGNLISDILQKNPLPQLVFAEQVNAKGTTIWNLDGKQRCTNVYSYMKNEFKISKNVNRWEIGYQVSVLNENGKEVLDEDGNPTYEQKVFDIRGKRFSELPEELQDRFCDYNFEIVQYLNCSKEDIAYHIARYNEGKPMTVSQKGITRVGEDFAIQVKAISNMPLFKDIGGYKVSEFKNGTINRVVIEGVMAANYLDDWKKKQEDMCQFIQDHAKAEDFENFEDMVNRLENVMVDEVSEIFDSKNSFIWFSLFSKFGKYGLEDKRFIQFMVEFNQSLHMKKINGVSYDDLNKKGTKDKNSVIERLNHLTLLMEEFLGPTVSSDKEANKNEGNTDIKKFVRDNVKADLSDEDIDQYEEVLGDLTVNVDNTSPLLEKRNLLSLVAVVAYAFENEIDLDEWIVEYFLKNNTYDQDQKENYLYMIKDLSNYLNKNTKKSA